MMNIDGNNFHLLNIIEQQNEFIILILIILLNPSILNRLLLIKCPNHNRQALFSITKHHHRRHHHTILNRTGKLKNFLQWKFWNIDNNSKNKTNFQCDNYFINVIF